MEEVFIKLSPPQGDLLTNMDDKKPIFHYILCKRRKKGQPQLQECTQKVQPLRKELSHITFQDLKEKMTVPIAQVSCIALEPPKAIGKLVR